MLLRTIKKSSLGPAASPPRANPSGAVDATDLRFASPKLGGRRNNVLQPLSGNASPVRRQATKALLAFESPDRLGCRPTSNDVSRSSPHLNRFQQQDMRDLENEAAIGCNSSDEEEVFFGAISEAEKTKAARLNKKRRRTMLDRAAKHQICSTVSPGIGSIAKGSGKIPPKRADYAARVIQDCFRAHRFRAHFDSDRIAARQETRTGAAVKMQSLYRGFAARKQVRDMHGATTVVMTAVLQEGHRRDDEAGDDCASDSDGSGPRSPPTLSDERFEMSPSKSGRAPRLSPSKPGQLLESTVEVEIPPRPVLESEPATAAVAVKPLTAVQVKMERLRQLREKRRLLEIKLQRGGGADGGAESRRDVRSTLLGLSGGSQVSSAGPASNDGGHLGLCRIPRRFQPSGVGRLQGITSNQDKELDRITRLNTARNSRTARCVARHGGTADDRQTYLRAVMDAYDNDASNGAALGIQGQHICWNEELTSCVPSKFGEPFTVRSILKQTDAQPAAPAPSKSITRTTARRLLVNPTMSATAV